MIKRTYMQVKDSPFLDEVVVATEDNRISDYCESENIPVIMTTDQCLTGTDRLAEVALKKDFDLYVNIQGDEPVIDPITIEQIVSQYMEHGDHYIAYNLYKVIDDMTQIQRDTIIKVAVNERDEVMYMSRLPIPYSNNKGVSVYRQQIPVYGYTKKALSVFAEQGRLGKTRNEQFEDIELLRFVDLGHKLKMAETFADSISVDVPEDVQKVERFLALNA